MTEDLLVLLALTSPDACHRLQSAIRKQGYRVITAQSGREAVRHLCTVVPAAIITEWEMPDLPAAEMQAILRAMCPAAARLVLTARPCLETSVAALEEGALAYLPADVDALTLLGRLHTALERRPEVLGDAEQQGALRRTQAEAALYKSALQHTSDLVAAVDPRYRYLYANHALLAYEGLQLDEVVGREAREVLGDSRFAAARASFDRCLAGDSARFETDCPHPTLGVRRLRVACHPLRDTDGVIIGVLTVGRDVTEEKQLSPSGRPCHAEEGRHPALLEYAGEPGTQ